MTENILVIDEGTTSTRAMLFSVDGICLGSAQRPITQHYPAAGLVEHDASEIWTLTLECARQAAKFYSMQCRPVAVISCLGHYDTRYEGSPEAARATRQ